MAQPVELRIGLKRGVASAGETTEAEVVMTFKLSKTDSDLGSLVESKFHEVQRALVRALDSEESSRRPDAAPGAALEGREDLDDWTTANPVRTVPAPNVLEEVPDQHPVEVEEAEAGLVPAKAVAPPMTEAIAAVPPMDDEDRLLVTPAQKRTIQSLCAAMGIDGRQLQGMIESGYNRKSIDSLGRREAGGLIFRLSQAQRERMLRDKETTAQPGFHQKQPEEVISHNGAGH